MAMTSARSVICVLFHLALVLLSTVEARDKVRYAVRCSYSQFDVIFNVTDQVTQLIANSAPSSFKECQSVRQRGQVLFSIDLSDAKQFAKCGVNVITYQDTDDSTYYREFKLRYAGGESDIVKVKCHPRPSQSHSHKVVKRSPQSADSWPEGFEEPEVLEITSEVVGRAPEPQLSVQVKQDNQLVDTALHVRPGSRLSMEIFLDDKSAGTYGIMVADMVVTDTDQAQEQILVEGCSVDPQLFGNFNTTNGDLLVAPFRAFKFPNTDYVLFRAHISVCIDRCEGVECSSGDIGHGRRRRSVVAAAAAAGDNSVFHVTTNTVIRVSYDSQQQQQQQQQHIHSTPLGHQRDSQWQPIGYADESTSGSEAAGEVTAVGYVKQLLNFANLRERFAPASQLFSGGSQLARGHWAVVTSVSLSVAYCFCR